MIEVMPRNPPPHVTHEHSRHGTWTWYHRIGHGKRTSLGPNYGTPEFWSKYHAAERGETLPAVSLETPRLSVQWCIEQFMASKPWADTAAESRKQMGYQLERVKNNAGKTDIRKITRKNILKGKQDREKVPSDANKYVRAMSLLFRFCVDQEWVSASPVVDIGKLETGKGFYTWTADDFDAFEARWQIGTMQRLAYEIYLGTGLRRGDVHKFGRQHIRSNIYTVTTGKTGMVVESEVPWRLRKAMDETKCGELTLLLTEKGAPFKSAQSLGMWFGRACKLAGIKQGNGHGIRKGVASFLATKRLTGPELNSFFGWSHKSNEAATYIDKADRARMAKQGTNIISRTLKKGAGLR